MARLDVRSTVVRPPRSETVARWLRPPASNCRPTRASAESERLVRSGLRKVVAEACPSASAEISV